MSDEGIIVHGCLSKIPLNESDRAELARLCIGLNALDFLHDVFFDDSPVPTTVEFAARKHEGNALHLYLLICSVLKETTDSIRRLKIPLQAAAAALVSKANEVPGGDYQSTAEALGRVLAAIDKDDAGSTFSRLIRPMRDEAGFHWKHSKIVDALSALEDRQLLRVRKGTVRRYPFAFEVLRHIAHPNNAVGELQANVSEIQRLVLDILDAMLPLVGYYLMQADCEVTEF